MSSNAFQPSQAYTNYSEAPNSINHTQSLAYKKRESPKSYVTISNSSDQTRAQIVHIVQPSPSPAVSNISPKTGTISQIKPSASHFAPSQLQVCTPQPNVQMLKQHVIQNPTHITVQQNTSNSAFSSPCTHSSQTTMKVHIPNQASNNIPMAGSTMQLVGSDQVNDMMIHKNPSGLSHTAIAEQLTPTEALVKSYDQLMLTLLEVGKDIKPCYQGNRASAERLKRGITQSKIHVRECLNYVDRMHKLQIADS